MSRIPVPYSFVGLGGCRVCRGPADFGNPISMLAASKRPGNWRNNRNILALASLIVGSFLPAASLVRQRGSRQENDSPNALNIFAVHSLFLPGAVQVLDPGPPV